MSDEYSVSLCEASAEYLDLRISCAKRPSLRLFPGRSFKLCSYSVFMDDNINCITCLTAEIPSSDYRPAATDTKRWVTGAGRKVNAVRTGVINLRKSADDTSCQ